MMRFYLTLISFLPLIVLGQEKEYEWSVALSNGYSYTEINSRSNLAGATNNRFYADQKEYYFLKPSIRLNTEKHFWSLRLNEFKFGRRFATGIVGDGYFIDYARLGFDVSFNHIVLNWKRFQFVIGESICFCHREDDGMHINNFLLEFRESSAFIQAIPRASFMASEKFSIEISSMLQIAEANLIGEVWSERFSSVAARKFRYSSINALNAIDVQLSLEYRF